MMTLNSNVCRVCLSVNVRMSPITATPLQFVYEKLTDVALVSAEPRPVTACYVCCALLDKSHKLMLMAAGAENVLTEIFQRYPKATNLASLIGDHAGLYASLFTAPTVHYTIGADGTNGTHMEGPVVLDDREFQYDVKLEVESDSEGPPQSPCDGSSDSKKDKLLKNLVSANQDATKMPLEMDSSGDVARDSHGKPLKSLRNPEGKSAVRTHSHSHDHTRWIGRKYYECNDCRGKFRLRSHLMRHLKTHSGEKPYECDICHQRCKQKVHLISHMRTHTGGGNFSCTLCPRKFTRKESLTHHLRTHTGEKPHICSICNRGFNRKRSLQSHFRTHTGEKPYECKFCKRRFREYGSLKRHVRVHTGESPYLCDYCELRFKQKSILVDHLRTHTGESPYECDVCQRRFKQKGSLNKHYRLHTGEKPYQCSVCGHKFKDRSNLTCHLRTHTGETPFSCKFCQRRFKQTAHLRLHIVRKHSVELQNIQNNVS